MFSIEQLIQLFNVKLAKSYLRKQLTENNTATSVLQEKVGELERWRLKFEMQSEKDLAQTNQRFAENEKTSAEFQTYCHKRFREVKNHYEAFELYKKEINTELNMLMHKNSEQDLLLEAVMKELNYVNKELSTQVLDNLTSATNRFKANDEFI